MLVLKAGVPKLRIDELAFSPDGGSIVAPAGAAGLCRWAKIGSGSKAEVLTLPAKVVKHVAFAPAGTIYAGNDQLCAFDLGSRTGTLVEIPKWGTLRFGVSPDGGRLVVAESPPQGVEGTRLTFWDTAALGAPTHEMSHAMTVHSVPLFPNGDRFLQIEGEFVPERRWEYRRVTRSASTGKVVERSDPFPDDPDQMILSPDGLTVACRTRATIRIYPASGGWGDVPTIQNDGKQHFTGIAFHPSGRFLAATSNDKTVKLYDAASGRVVRVFTWAIGRMRSVAFSPDGVVAAAGSETGKVVVWDVDE
ncbi:MAG TPA: WD40 repeat domain-containing protein [Urbifossiella sp.]|nr:WD40 repeat domain-containing protein [Urbifossiella sp.]